MNTSVERAPTPWHLWVIGVVSLLWNGFGAFDYVMTQTANEAYMSSFTPEQLEFFYGFPVWFVALWALAVWGAALGSILLLLRSKYAGPLFMVSLGGTIVNAIYTYAFTIGFEIMGAIGAVFSAVIVLVAALLVIYAKRMERRGVLR